MTAGILAIAYVGFSLIVAADALHRFDLEVASSFATIYVPALLPVFRIVALLGGIELTGLLGLGLFIYLWRQGYRLGAFAVGALPLASVVELVYKHTINHPPNIKPCGSTGLGCCIPPAVQKQMLTRSNSCQQIQTL